MLTMVFILDWGMVLKSSQREYPVQEDSTMDDNRCWTMTIKWIIYMVQSIDQFNYTIL